MIKALNKNRRNDTLYVRLVSSDAGAVVSGETLSSLPPSVLNVLEGERSGGNFNPFTTRRSANGSSRRITRSAPRER